MKNNQKLQPFKPVRVVVFFSGGASSLKYLFEHDSNLDKKYRIVGAFTDMKDSSGIAFVKQVGIKLKCLDICDWCRVHNKKLTDLKARQSYFAEVSSLIKPFQADIIMLSGFMRIVTEPLLGEYENRILNVHPADLTILDGYGQRKYIGTDAVAKAIATGEKSTRSTIHLVTADVDGGPIVALSDPLPVEPGIAPAVHQEKMKWACDGPAYARALMLIADKESLAWLNDLSKGLKAADL